MEIWELSLGGIELDKHCRVHTLLLFMLSHRKAHALLSWLSLRTSCPFADGRGAFQFSFTFGLWRDWLDSRVYRCCQRLVSLVHSKRPPFLFQIIRWDKPITDCYFPTFLTHPERQSFAWVDNVFHFLRVQLQQVISGPDVRHVSSNSSLSSRRTLILLLVLVLCILN